MRFPYTFTSPDEAQLQRRRHLLDTYGQVAQISALIPLLAYQIPLLVRLLKDRTVYSSRSRSGAKEHASPVTPSFGRQPVEGAKPQTSWWDRLAWRLDEEVLTGWGTWRVLLVATTWTAWLLLLAIRDTGDDYLHLTKRFGIIAASQLPLHYLLAVKSSYSPISLLTRLSHEELNPYHRALGRILLLLLSLHASFYLNFYVQKSLLLKRIRDADVILGLLAITSLLVLGTTALAWIRRKNYLLFFILHVTLSISLLPTLYFHVSHLRPYILESALVYALLILQRNISQTKTPSAALHPLPGTKNLISVSVALPPALRTRTFHPGQHIYLSLPASNPQGKLRLNPFTVANLPAKDKHIQLVLRALDGTTALLAAAADPQPQPLKKPTLLIEGPYGAAANFPTLASFPRILLVAGGVGATFTLPIYRDLLDRVGGDAAVGSRVKFVWAVKSLADARWAMPHLGKGSEVYVSPKPRQRQASRAEEEDDDDDDAMEMQERTGLMAEGGKADENDDDADDADSIPSHITLHRSSRPDFRLIVNEVFSTLPPPAKVAVLVCGPAGMGAALRREVGVWVRRGREVWWHGEEFAW